MAHTRTSALRQELRPQLLLPTITAGVIAGVLGVVLAISFGALIFSGELADYLPRGIGFLLFGLVVNSAFAALTSSFPNIVSVPQDSPAAIFATMAAAVIASFSVASTTGDIFATMAAAITITTILTGAFSFLLGKFQLGNLVRFIPYPVVGGFLAGTGYFLAHGALNVMTGENISTLPPLDLLRSDLLLHWLPGIGLGVALLLIERRYHHFMIIPLVLAASFILFHLVLLLTNTSLEQALKGTLLLGPFPDAGLWRPPDLRPEAGIDWSVIVGQAPRIATIAVVSVFSLLLNLSGLEVVARRDLDLNRELQVSGIANMLSGAGGSTPGYAALSLSVLGTRLGTSSRFVGVIVALIGVLTLVVGASVISFIPRFIVGGLLFFLGISFLVEWLIDGWSRFSKQDYGIIIVILLVMAGVGVLEGVGIGMIFAIILFVANYSRIDVIKHNFSGTYYRSTVERAPREEMIITRRGDLIQILELQGFLFFGTANALLNRVRTWLDDAQRTPPHYLIVDFRHVAGLDVSATMGFAKLQQLVQSRAITVIYTGLTDHLRQRFEKEVLATSAQGTWRTFPDLDHGMEWCEEQLVAKYAAAELASLEPPPRDGTMPHGMGFHFIESMLHQDIGELRGSEYVNTLIRITKYFERKIVGADQTLIRVGTKAGGLYLIESGQATVIGTTPANEDMRLRLLGSGSVAGEVSLYLDTVASASVITARPTILYYLSAENLRKIEESDPQVALVLHRFLGRILSERLVRSTGLLEAISGT